jgi:hypothetical protein
MVAGIVMSLVRVFGDRAMRFELKRLIMQFFGEIPHDMGTDLQLGTEMEGTLVSFLMSSFNIELVHIILRVVSGHTVGTSKVDKVTRKDSHLHESTDMRGKIKSFDVYQAYDFKNNNQFDIDCIKIEDVKDWDI